MNKVFRSVFSSIKPVRSSVSARRVSNANFNPDYEDQFIIRSKLEDVNIPNISMLELLWKEIDQWPDKIAIECAETRKNYTYRQLHHNTRRFATSLVKKLGLSRGDVVATVLPNMPEFAVATLGSIQAGCIVSTMNPIYTEYEFNHQFALTKPKVIITINECYETVAKSLNNINLETRIVIADRNSEDIPPGAIRLSEIGETGDVDEHTLNRIKQEMDDLIFLPFSSGTTGLPKAVQITQANMVAALKIVSHKKVCLPQPSVGNYQDVVPCVLPFFHIYGMVITMIGHLQLGCKLIAIPRFNGELYLDILKKDRASLLYVVPPLAIFLGKHDAVTPEHLASVKYALSGAAPLASVDISALITKAKHLEVFQAYGTTETSAVCATMHIGSEKDYNGVGYPVSNTDLRLVCPTTGRVLPPDQLGELQVRGPQVTRGYYQNEQANEESFTSDGFYCTGDLASYTEAGGLRIQDRLKELIKVKGLQVAPAELEAVLRSHPEILEAAVIGTPHPTLGEAPRAFVVPKNKASAPTLESLKEFVAGKVARFKKIHQLQYVDELPKTNTGKILKRKLKEMYE